MNVINLSNSHLTDETIVPFLRDLPIGTYVNFSFNRLTSKSVELMVRYLQTDPTSRFEVGSNAFGFDNFYEVLKSMGEEDLIRARRINMSSNDADWRIEQLALDAKLDKRIIQFEDIIEKTLSLITTEASQRVADNEISRARISQILDLIEVQRMAGLRIDKRIEDVSEQMRKLGDSVLGVTKWHANRIHLSNICVRKVTKILSLLRMKSNAACLKW